MEVKDGIGSIPWENDTDKIWSGWKYYNYESFKIQQGSLVSNLNIQDLRKKCCKTSF